MIDRARMEQALDFLATTDEEYAQLRTNVKRCEYLLKRKEAIAYVSHDGTVKERKVRSRLDAEVQAAYDSHTDSMELFERISAKRQTEALIIEIWRSLESSRRLGQ